MKRRKILIVANDLGDIISLKSLALALRATDNDVYIPEKGGDVTKAIDNIIEEVIIYKLHAQPNMDDMTKVRIAEEKYRKPWVSDKYVGPRRKKF